jgi:hypothetical protein
MLANRIIMLKRILIARSPVQNIDGSFPWKIFSRALASAVESIFSAAAACGAGTADARNHTAVQDPTVPIKSGWCARPSTSTDTSDARLARGAAVVASQILPGIDSHVRVSAAGLVLFSAILLNMENTAEPMAM